MEEVLVGEGSRREPPRRFWKCPHCGAVGEIDEFDYVWDATRDPEFPSWLNCDQCESLTPIQFRGFVLLPFDAEVTEPS